MYVNVESKKMKKNVASLPRGAVGKGAFAERSGQLRSATLRKICLPRVFPVLPSVVARGPRQRIFFKKIKNRLCPRPLPGALCTKKSKKNPLFADGPASRPSAKKISKTVNLTPR
jgi:hypothetical protein